MENESMRQINAREEINAIVDVKQTALTAATNYNDMSPEERRSKIEFAEGMARINAIVLGYINTPEALSPFTMNDIRLAAGWPIKNGPIFGDVMTAPQDAFSDPKYDRRIPEPDSESPESEAP